MTRTAGDPLLRRKTLVAVLRRTPLKEVNSSAVARAGYDPQTRMVAVQFTGAGTVYGYPNLTDAEIEGLIAVLEHSASLGHYIATVIKPAHDHERVRL